MRPARSPVDAALADLMRVLDALGVEWYLFGAQAAIPGGYDYGFTAYLHSQAGLVTSKGSVTTDGHTVKMDIVVTSSIPSSTATHGELVVGPTTLTGSVTSTYSGDTLGTPSSEVTMRPDLQSQDGCITGGTVDIDGKNGDDTPVHIRFRWSGCDVVACD